MKKLKLFLTIFLFLSVANNSSGKAIFCIAWEGRVMCEIVEDFDCDHLPPKSDMTYCKDLFLSPIKPPIIFRDESGNATLDNNGELTRIASDKLRGYLKNIGKISTEEFEKGLNAIIKSDDGFVSPERLKKISVEFNAEIRYSASTVQVNFCPPGYEMKNGKCEKMISRVNNNLNDEEFIKSLFITQKGKKILNPRLFELLTQEKQIKGMKMYVRSDVGKVYKFIGDQERLLKMQGSKDSAVAKLVCAKGTICNTTVCNGTKLNCYCWANGFCCCPLCIELSTLTIEPEDTLMLKAIIKKQGP